jgi:K+-transporting ATPase c subunit
MPVVPIRNLIKAYEASREEAAANLSLARSRSIDASASSMMAGSAIEKAESKQPKKKAKTASDSKPPATAPRSGSGSSGDVSPASPIAQTTATNNRTAMQADAPKPVAYKSNIDEMLARKNKTVAVSRKMDSDDGSDLDLPELNIDAPVDN